jgi:hypothetical protein
MARLLFDLFAQIDVFTIETICVPLAEAVMASEYQKIEVLAVEANYLLRLEQSRYHPRDGLWSVVGVFAG